MKKLELFKELWKVSIPHSKTQRFLSFFILFIYLQII